MEISGRDALQSEMLYRRYLKKGDIFVHADLKGATPVIVKNRQGNPDSLISPSTLSQAGTLCVATSSAWESKAVMSAWWVQADQVSKSAGPAGILPTGEFAIKGEKNFLAPSQLVLGLGVMFQISKESVRNHKGQLFDQLEPVEQPATNSRMADSEKADLVAESKASSAEEKNPSAETTNHAEGANEQQRQEQSSESEDEEHPNGGRLENPLQPNTSEPSDPGNDVADKTVDSESEAEDEHEKEEETEEVHGVEGNTERKAAPGNGEVPSDDKHAAPRPGNKRHLSARERRLLRKAKPLEPSESGKPIASETSPTIGEASSVPSTIDKPQPVGKPAHAPARGKKAKGKKATSKYAYQDEEERELALRLLGANNAKAQKAAADSATKADRAREAELQKQRRRAQHDRAAEAERKRQALFEEGEQDEETAVAEAADLSWLPALIGTPTPEDEILAAIPVCAPWAALGRYKYRVKLQPGSVKKGKAVKEIVGRWVAETTTGKVKKEHAEDAGINRAAAEELRAKEGELIRGWKDSEIVNSVPVGGVRIMLGAAGGGGRADGKGKGKGAGGKGGKGGKKK